MHDSLTHDSLTLDAGLSRRLRALASQLRSLLLIEGLAFVAAFAAASALFQFAVDYGTRGLRWSIRAAILVAVVVGLLSVLWRRLIRPLTVRIDLADVANMVERKFPYLSSALISAVRFSTGEIGPIENNSPTLVAHVVRRASPLASSINFAGVLDARRAKRAAGVLVLTVGAAVAVVLASPTMTQLWFERNVMLCNTPWPKRTHLIVNAGNGELIGARGDDFVVQAVAEGVQPGEVEFFYETVSGQTGRDTMVSVGSAGSVHYRYTLKNAQEDFEFYLRGGDHQTDPLRVRLVDRPQVETSRISVVPPAYTRLESSVLPEGERLAQVLRGSSVTIRIDTNKPVVKATLIGGDDPVTDAGPDASGYSATFTPTDSQTYYFDLRDDLGFDDREPTRFAIRVIKDEAPRVRLHVGGAGEMITPQAVLPIDLDYADTYGLAAATLMYRATREDQREELIPISGFEAYSRTFSTSLPWPVSEAGVTPGDRLTLLAEASDYDDVSGPNAGTSPELTFRIVTPDELLAELARREQEFRMDFERLLDAQEQLRGRLLTLMGPAGPAAGSGEFSSSLADLERRQRSVAQSVGVVRQQVEQVLAELRINQLAEREVEERLGSRIAQPLSTLTAREFPAAADGIRRWAREPGAEMGAEIDARQVALLAQMREILANMIQWEGYQEAVSMLRDILRLQNELKAETQDAIEKQSGDIFEK